MKTALITGITGQDGSYLAEFLLDKDYMVHGIKRRSSSFNTERIDHVYEHPNLKLHYGDLTDTASLISILQQIQPDEVYNLGAQSHVRVSFDIPEYTSDVVGMGAVRMLEALNILRMHKVRYYQASSSEMFGLVQEVPQKETTPFYPRSPYGCAKVFAYWITRNYRDSYNMHASNGILFNHESPVRGETFVTQKVVQAAVNISKGRQDTLSLGNLDAQRDWGHAKDYVEAQWLILQQDEPDDYVIATGKMYSVRQLVEFSFKYLDMPIKWVGTGIDEVGIYNNKILVKIDPQYFRPAEVDELLGDPTKAKKQLGWKPKYTFESMIKEMIDVELIK